MIVDVATYLDAAPQTIWDHVTRPRLLKHVALPLIVFTSREPGGFPEHWSEGPHRVWMWQFGFIPLGAQTVGIEIGPHYGETLRVRDNGSGWLARVWDHVITLTPEGAGTRYRDCVRIEARLLTPMIWAFAMIFYRWRQMRWRALVRRGFRY